MAPGRESTVGGGRRNRPQARALPPGGRTIVSPEKWTARRRRLRWPHADEEERGRPGRDRGGRPRGPPARPRARALARGGEGGADAARRRPAARRSPRAQLRRRLRPRDRGPRRGDRGVDAVEGARGRALGAARLAGDAFALAREGEDRPRPSQEGLVRRTMSLARTRPGRESRWSAVHPGRSFTSSRPSP